MLKADHNEKVGFVAHKQSQKLVVSESDDDMIVKKIEADNGPTASKSIRANTTSKLILVILE